MERLTVSDAAAQPRDSALHNRARERLRGFYDVKPTQSKASC